MNNTSWYSGEQRDNPTPHNHFNEIIETTLAVTMKNSTKREPSRCSCVFHKKIMLIFSTTILHTTKTKAIRFNVSASNLFPSVCG